MSLISSILFFCDQTLSRSRLGNRIALGPSWVSLSLSSLPPFPGAIAPLSAALGLAGWSEDVVGSDNNKKNFIYIALFKNMFTKFFTDIKMEKIHDVQLPIRLSSVQSRKKHRK